MSDRPATIKLRLIRDVSGEEIGNVLIDVDSIESVEEFDHELHKGSEVTMKPVINGFSGDSDRIFKYQRTYQVAQSVGEIEELMKG